MDCNPFGKMRFLGVWKIEFFRAKKGFFSIYNIFKQQELRHLSLYWTWP